MTKETTRHLPINPVDPAPGGDGCGSTGGVMPPHAAAVFTWL